MLNGFIRSTLITDFYNLIFNLKLQGFYVFRWVFLKNKIKPTIIFLAKFLYIIRSHLKILFFNSGILYSILNRTSPIPLKIRLDLFEL